MKKRVLSMILAVMMAFSMLAPASAATPDEISDQCISLLNDEGIVPFAANRPSFGSITLLPYQAKLTDLAASRGSYTRFCFITSTYRLNLSCVFEHSGTSDPLGRTLEIKLYKYTSWTDDGGNLHINTHLVETKTVNAAVGTRSVTFSNLIGNTQYFFLFRNISHTSSSSGRDISATINITG